MLTEKKAIRLLYKEASVCHYRDGTWMTYAGKEYPGILYAAGSGLGTLEKSATM